MRPNLGRLRFRKDDPLRYLHVPAAERLAEDPADGSDDATDPVTGEAGTEELDRDTVRRRGGVAPPEQLR